MPIRGRVNQLAITDSGSYYNAAPLVSIEPPYWDSSAFADIDSATFKFGYSSLLHSTTTTNSNSLFTFLENYGEDSNPHEIAFWILPTTIGQSTLVYGSNFRIFMDSNGYVGLSASVDPSVQDPGSNSTQTKYNTTRPLVAGQWQFVHVEIIREQIGINIDSDAGTVHAYDLSVGNKFILDSGDILKIGHDPLNAAPAPVGLVNYNNSFIGNIDNITFTRDTVANSLSLPQSERVPDSSGSYYFDKIPVFVESFDFGPATATSTIDSFGHVNGLIIVDSGWGYVTAPAVTLTGTNTVDSAYTVGDNIKQQLANTIIRGEVTGYKLDSALDSARYLYLAHVGADDGKYHEFITDVAIINSTTNKLTGLYVTAKSEENRLSENEQNTDFSVGSDDFMDFSEVNPFGDPELN
jgi:hypothetical protein